MTVLDGENMLIGILDIKEIFRLIESVPSPKAEPFKMWLVSLGKERIDEAFDPSIAAQRSIDLYRAKGYDEKWIAKRLKGIQDRKELTDIWKDGGITEGREYAILTNEIYREWSGMTAKEYKEFKGLRKEFLRDNMTDIESALANISEIATRDIAIEEKPQGFKENMKVAKRGGGVANDARKSYEKAVNKPAITKENSLNYEYIDRKQIDSK